MAYRSVSASIEACGLVGGTNGILLDFFGSEGLMCILGRRVERWKRAWLEDRAVHNHVSIRS